MKAWAIRGGVVLVVLLAAITGVYGFGRGSDAEVAAGPEVQAAARRDIEVTAEAAGIIQPIRLVEVKSKASGEILRLHVESGDAVKRGDLLGEIDPRDVRNAFDQAEADLHVAEARAKTAEAQLKRSEELRAAMVITEQELESATFEHANAQAQLVKARTNLQLAQERLSDVTIRAPSDGVIIQKNAEEGTIIQSGGQSVSGGTAVFVMADLSIMQVRTLVDETDLGKIRAGQTARVSVDAYPGRTFLGTVSKIEPQAVVEQNVTMFPVLVELDNADGSLRPGMNGEVVVEVDRRSDVVAVPNASIVAMRDAAAAGALFGLDEDRMRSLMRPAGERQPAMNEDAPAQQPAATDDDGAASPNPAVARRNGQTASPDGASPQRGRGARGAGGQGGFGGRARMGGRGAAGGGAATTRMGVVFVQAADGSVEPRPVTIGLNDWEYTEIVRGVQPGEEVVLISVARLQQQQQDMLDNMRERSSGSPFSGAQGGGRRR